MLFEKQNPKNGKLFFVLILILMEYALWVNKEELSMMGNNQVLILILMEYALWGRRDELVRKFTQS